MNVRVLVTGLGVVTPLGAELGPFFEALVAGRSGVVRPPASREHGAPVHALGLVPSELRARLARSHLAAAAGGDPRTLYAAGAAAAALADAGLPGTAPGARGARAGVALGTGPGTFRIEDEAWGYGADGRFDAARFRGTLARRHGDSPLRHPPSAPAVYLARTHGLCGPLLAPLTACSAGLQALGLALRAIRAGEADWMLAGGSDAGLESLGLVWFAGLGAAAAPQGTPQEASRPFDRRRTGLVAAEGAAVVVLESEDHARARGARVRAELAGYGSALDAYRPTEPFPDGRGTAESMRRALADAGLAPEDVDYVCTHGSGTAKNDPAEVAAVKAVFGPHAARLVAPSLKSMLGHLLAASGAVGFASTVLSVERDLVPPTSTLRTPDPRCDLDHVPGTARARSVRAALVNALAFGGANATLAVRRWQDAAAPRPAGTGGRA